MADITKRARVFILGTGGTISGESADPILGGGFYTAGKRTIEALVSAIPELQQIADVYAEQVCNIPSHTVDTGLWVELAGRINALFERNEADGVVITHGTDSMEETAYFLNLAVKFDRPVVLVGAMRPSNALSSDGQLNLVNAVRVAASPFAWGKGVLVVTDGKINGARDVTKSNTLAVETFNSHELGYLGYVAGNEPSFYRMSTRRHTVRSEFDAEDLRRPACVTIVYGHAGQSLEIVKTAIAISDGIVQAGMGNGSMNPKVQALLDEAVFAKHIAVVRTSRTGNGIITNKPVFKNSNFVCGDNLNPQKARILLMFALSKTRNVREIQRIFNEY